MEGEKSYVDERVSIPCSRAGEADGGVGAPVDRPTTVVSRRNGLAVGYDRVCGCCGTVPGSWSGPAGPVGIAVAAGNDGADGDAGGQRIGADGRPARIARAEVHRRCAGDDVARPRVAVAAVTAVAVGVAVADNAGGATAATVAVVVWDT